MVKSVAFTKKLLLIVFNGVAKLNEIQ